MIWYMNKIILDSDFLYGLFIPSDPHYTNCQNLAERIEQDQLLISNLVIYEIITLLSRRFDQKTAITVVEQIEGLEQTRIIIDEKLDIEILKEFSKYSKKNISAVDCSNLVLAKKYKAKIASFDEFYPQEYLA